MVIQGCPWIITCNNFRQWTTINQTNWCYSATLTVAIFNLLCRLQTGLRTFKFIEAGNSHQQRHHFGDSLECWSLSVSQCPLITSSCLPVNMESTNSLIFEDNNFKNSFMGAAFGASYKAYTLFVHRNTHFLCIWRGGIFVAESKEWIVTMRMILRRRSTMVTIAMTILWQPRSKGMKNENYFWEGREAEEL